MISFEVFSFRTLVEEKDNRLVECHECHSKYHQKCHKPPVSTADISDPRCLWYCSKCRKIITKRVRENIGKFIENNRMIFSNNPKLQLKKLKRIVILLYHLPNLKQQN